MSPLAFRMRMQSGEDEIRDEDDEMQQRGRVSAAEPPK